MAKSKLSAEDQFLEAWNEHGFPGSDLTRQYRFHPIRRWAFDFAFPSARLAIEIDGRGRHQTVTGVRSDCEKGNTAILFGWAVLHLPTSDLSGRGKDGEPLIERFIELVCEILTQRLTKSDKARLDKQMETVPFVPTTPPCQAPRSLPRKHPL